LQKAANCKESGSANPKALGKKEKRGGPRLGATVRRVADVAGLPHFPCKRLRISKESGSANPKALGKKEKRGGPRLGATVRRVADVAGLPHFLAKGCE
jgi:hypothetical protein